MIIIVKVLTINYIKKERTNNPKIISYIPPKCKTVIEGHIRTVQ